MSILAKLASATLSLFQSMMKRPSIAPSRMGTISGIGLSLRIIPPTCCPSPRGACRSCGASSVSSRHPAASTRSRKAGSASIASRSPPSCDCSCFESSRRSSRGNPSAFPRSCTIPFSEYVAIAPASTAYSAPKCRCTRAISSSRSARGKSRSMSGRVAMSSGMKRSRVSFQRSGSTWLMPIR